MFEKLCFQCGAGVVGRTRHRQLCPSCRLDAKRASAREQSWKKSRERGAPEIGKPSACEHCKSEFVRTGATSKYCPKCRSLSVAGKLPGLRVNRREIVDRYNQRNRECAVRRERLRLLAREKRERRKANPAFSINERMSAAVRSSLACGKQGSSWEDLVGYSLHDLMAHLESKFKPGMSWANRAEWHIDHIIPLSWFRFSANTDEQFRQCWALSNLQPLFAEDNIRKNNRLSGIFG